MSGFKIKYSDEDGDLCTLTERTMADFASIANEGVVRLTLTKPIPSVEGENMDTAPTENGAALVKIEVTYNGETRQGTLNIVTEASPAEAFSNIQCSLASLFDMPLCSMSNLQIKYSDEDGDLCTLIEPTVSDFLLRAPEGILHLTITPTPASVNGLENNMDVTEGSLPAEAPAHGNPKHAEEASCTAADDEFRAKLQCLVQKHLPPGFQPMLLALVRDMDPISLHGLIAHALSHRDAIHEHHHAAMSDHEVWEVLRALQSMDAGAMHALVLEVLGKATGPTSESSTSCSPQQSWLEALFGAKGCGKGYEAGATPTPNPLAHLLGPLLAGKGFGKGAGAGAGSGCHSQSANPMPAFAPLLGAFLGGTGSFPGASPNSSTQGMGSFPDASPNSSTPDNSNSNDEAARRPAFEESVTDLLNMGLVTDRQVARSLLTEHGDISSVVAVLTESLE